MSEEQQLPEQPKRKRGRPKGSKNKGYGKRGRPSRREIKDLLTAKNILEEGSLEAAYKKTHPNSQPQSTKANCHRILTPEVKEYIHNLLEMEQLAKTTRENMEKFFYLVIARWAQGKEKTSDYLRALENLKELVSDFKKHSHVEEDVYNKTPEEIDKELLDFGIDVSKLSERRDGKAELN